MILKSNHQLSQHNLPYFLNGTYSVFIIRGYVENIFYSSKIQINLKLLYNVNSISW